MRELKLNEIEKINDGIWSLVGKAIKAGNKLRKNKRVTAASIGSHIGEAGGSPGQQDLGGAPGEYSMNWLPDPNVIPEQCKIDSSH